MLLPISRAREIAQAHYQAAVAAQEQARAAAQLAVTQAEAAMSDYNPFNDIGAYTALDDAYNSLLQVDAAVAAARDRNNIPDKLRWILLGHSNILSAGPTTRM